VARLPYFLPYHKKLTTKSKLKNQGIRQFHENGLKTVTSRPDIQTDRQTFDERKNSLSRRIGDFARSVKKLIRNFVRTSVLYAIYLLNFCLDANWAVIVLFLLGKVAITCSFGVAFTYTAELYPTLVRSAGVGSCCMIARIGALVAPFAPLMVSGKL